MSLTQSDLAIMLRLPPRDAIEYIRSQGLTVTWNWWERLSWIDEHSFTVAKVVKLEILQLIQNMIEEALETGITLETFMREVNTELATAGWLERTTPLGPLPPYRWLTIFRTNLRSAYNAARWRVFEENAVNRPYLMWIHVNRGALGPRDRPEHVRLHGIVLPLNDPFWTYFYPPQGYNCRCRVRSFSQQQVERRGLLVQHSHGVISSEPVQVGNTTTEIKVFKGLDRKGKPFEAHTEPGFDFNAGQRPWQPNLAKYDPQLQKAYLDDHRSAG